MITYGPHQTTRFTRAVPPWDEEKLKIEDKMIVLKTLGAEAGIAALIYNQITFDFFWDLINIQATGQFQEVSSYSKTIYFQIGFPQFQYKLTPTSLSYVAIGQDLPALVMSEEYTDGKLFTTKDWKNLLDSAFHYLDGTRVPPTTWDKISKAQRIILDEYASRAWADCNVKRQRQASDGQWTPQRVIAELVERANNNPLPEAAHSGDWHGKCAAEATASMRKLTAQVQEMTITKQK